MRGRITITFDHDGGPDGYPYQAQMLDSFRKELGRDMRATLEDDFAEGGQNLMGYDGPLIDPVTIEVLVEVGNEAATVAATDPQDPAEYDEFHAEEA